MRRLVISVFAGVLLTGCGGAQSHASPPKPTSSTTMPPASATATPSPVGFPTATAAPPAPESASPPPPAAPTNAQPAGFAPCPGGGPPSGEPPARDNGPSGACFAAEILYPAGGATCHPAGGGTYSGTANCPLYPRLAQRLDQHPLSGPTGGADALCRCQNTYQSATYAVSGPTQDGPTTYRVRVKLVFGATSQQTLDVIVQAVQSGSLVSDVQCGGGGASSSILETPAASNNYLRC